MGNTNHTQFAAQSSDEEEGTGSDDCEEVDEVGTHLANHLHVRTEPHLVQPATESER